MDGIRVLKSAVGAVAASEVGSEGAVGRYRATPDIRAVSVATHLAGIKAYAVQEAPVILRSRTRATAVATATRRRGAAGPVARRTRVADAATELAVCVAPVAR